MKFEIIFGVLFVWCIAMAIKAIAAVRAGEGYTFGLWDGGLLRDGKTLSEAGTRIKIGTALAMATSVGLSAAHVLPHPWVMVTVIASAGASIVCDLVTTLPAR